MQMMLRDKLKHQISGQWFHIVWGLDDTITVKHTGAAIDTITV